MKIDGMKVVDAKRKLKLEISNDDVKQGKTKEPGTCAAAKACLRQVKDIKAVRVHLSRVYMKIEDKQGEKWVRYLTPDPLRNEIIAFDRGGTFEPGQYTLNWVQPSTQFGVKKKRYDTSKGPRHGVKQGKRSKPHRVENVRVSALVRGSGSNRKSA